MAYFDNNANFYPTFSVPEELYAYQSLNQTLAIEETNNNVYGTFANHWGTDEQPGPTTDLSTSLWDVTSHESLAPVTSYPTYTDGYGQLSYADNYWSAIQQARFYVPEFSSRDVSFADTAASEMSIAVPTPSSVPLGYWGANQSGPSTGTFYAQNVQPSYQPSASPTELIPAGQFQMYGMDHAHLSEYRNAEAGPSTLVPPPVPYVGPPTLQPSGGITSETTADAEYKPTMTEEDEAPATEPTRRPRSQRPPRHHRKQMEEGYKKLCDWVKWWMGLREAPSFNSALTVAADVISTIRPLENPEPRLLTWPGRRTTAGSRHADGEFARRNAERELFQELSQYYPRKQGQRPWARPSLLSNVVKDLEDLAPLPE